MDAINDVTFWIASSLMAVGFITALLRLAIGPTFADRALALDVLGITGVGVAAVAAVAGAGSYALDVALVIALASGVGTLAFARFIATHAEDE